jgi:hypothetical protein
MFLLKPGLKAAAMAALFGLSCASGATGDIGSFVARLEDPLLQEILGSVQAQLFSLEHRVDAERKHKAAQQTEMQAQMTALQADNRAKQAQIDSLDTKKAQVDYLVTRLEHCEASTNRVTDQLAQVEERVGRECPCPEAGRRLQSTGPEGQGEYVRIYKVMVDSAMVSQTVRSEHRRALEEEVSCDKSYVHKETTAISTECPIWGYALFRMHRGVLCMMHSP